MRFGRMGLGLVRLGIVGSSLVAGAAWAQGVPSPDPPSEAPPSPPSDPAPSDTAPSDTAPTAPEGPTDTATAEYERHMANGIKLFKEEDFNGAIVEFEAAYDAQPKASPLINIALTYKKLREPAKAIEALERALRDHADTTPEDQKIAARREIEELKALIAYVPISVQPSGAKVFIDGRPVDPDDMSDGLLELSPGTRVLRVTAGGHEPQEKTVTVRSGRKNAIVVIELEATRGRLYVKVEDPSQWIEVDGKKVAQGRFEDSLPPGLHIVRVIDDDGDARRIDVVLTAGGMARVVEDEDGELKSAAAAPTQPEPNDGFGPPEVPDILRGIYFQGSGALITAIPLEGEDRNFTAESSPGRFGGSGGLHIGYRVTDWAGFEVFGQVSDIRMAGDINITDPSVDGPDEVVDVQMKLLSVRFGGMMRVMVPGRGLIRFVGNVGGGAAYDELRFREGFRPSGERVASLPPPYNAPLAKGLGFIAQVDFGVELEVQNVLIDLVVQNVFQSSKHFDAENENRVLNAFNTAPILIAGPALRVGYALW